MANIQVITLQDQLVVDSRLIADELGIKHENLRKTVEKYLTELQEFGIIVFETQKILEGASRGRPERYCYLNEDQATFLMTLSRNTPQVVACKQNLVKAFSKAKHLITEATHPPRLSSERELEIELEIAKTKLEIAKVEAKAEVEKEWVRKSNDRIIEELRLEQAQLLLSQYSAGKLTPEQLLEKLLDDMAAFIDQVVEEKGVMPKVRDLHQKFQNRKIPDEKGNLSKLNSHVIRTSILPKALERVKVSRTH
jgi:phage regulator Rha-like protein